MGSISQVFWDWSALQPPVTKTAPVIQNMFPAMYGDPNVMGATLYFNTNQKGSKNGSWELSHASHKWMQIHYGMTWVEFRKILRNLFMSPVRDLGIVQSIKPLIMDVVPVRSGRLLDTILNTLSIVRKRFISSHYWVNMRWLWSRKRPLPIQGNVRHPRPNATHGYGELYTPKHSIPNRHLVRVVKGSPKRPGRKWVGFYRLNDPNALNNPSHYISDIGIQKIVQDTKQVIRNTLITYNIQPHGYVKGQPI